MKAHSLKTWPGLFKQVVNGSKQFEYRKDDRGFEVGDILLLQEWDPKTEAYTGNVAQVNINNIWKPVGSGTARPP